MHRFLCCCASCEKRRRMAMNTNDDNREKDAAKGEPVPLQPIIDMGSTVVKNRCV